MATRILTWTVLAGGVLWGTAGRAQTILPAEQKIAAATRMIQANPTNVDGYNQLALGYARRARETSDTVFYAKAEEAIGRALSVAPSNFEAQKMRVWVLLGKHEFAKALDAANALNKQMPDDLLVYGFLTDANVELGRYQEAEEACQWMLDLRPGNIPAFTRAAYLRELFGDLDGAIELMSAAFQRTPVSEVEDRAWILTQIAHLQWTGGHIDNADRTVSEALTLVPDYHYALATLAKVRTAQHKTDDAIALLKRRYDAAPHAENLYALAEALHQAGRTGDATHAFEEFERRALLESATWDNANRELIFYYADRAGRPADALRIAELEFSRRKDVHTLDAYAWALHANGRGPEAQRHIEQALAVGTNDPEMLARASIIARHAATPPQ